MDSNHNQQPRRGDDRAAEAVFFNAILHPNRSLSPRGFRLLMAGVVMLSLTVGSFFFAIGAWPVVGFLGLDVLLLYCLFRANYKSGRTYETVKLTESRLVVDRRDHWGKHTRWTFQPYWLHVHIAEPVEHDSQIRLTSHGKSITIGSFLAPEERADFAAALQRALDRWRRPQAALAAE